MKTTALSTLQIAAITFLLSAAACNTSTTTENSGENTANANSDSSYNSRTGELSPPASTVMNAEGNGTVESRQMPATDGAGGAPGSDAVMSASTSGSAGTASPTAGSGSKK